MCGGFVMQTVVFTVNNMVTLAKFGAVVTGDLVTSGQFTLWMPQATVAPGRGWQFAGRSQCRRLRSAQGIPRVGMGRG